MNKIASKCQITDMVIKNFIDTKINATNNLDEHFEMEFMEDELREKIKAEMLNLNKDIVERELGLLRENKISEIEEEIKKRKENYENELKNEEYKRKIKSLRTVMIEGLLLAFFMGLLVNQCTNIIDLLNENPPRIVITLLIIAILLIICLIIVFYKFFSVISKKC